jgi:hypothetical protein
MGNATSGGLPGRSNKAMAVLMEYKTLNNAALSRVVRQQKGVEAVCRRVRGREKWPWK